MRLDLHGLGDLRAGVDARCVLDLALGPADPQVIASDGGALERDDREVLAEEAALDAHERRLIGRDVVVDLLELAELLVLGIDDVPSAPLREALDGDGDQLDGGREPLMGSGTRAPGDKTIARVTANLARPPATPRMTEPDPTILIVEDDAATRTFLADNLTADGYDALLAETAKDGQRMLEYRHPDLVVLDLMLPDEPGLALLERLRASDGLASRMDPGVPMLVLTGRDSELDRVRGFQRGADDYLVKPFSYPELLERVAALLRRARPRAALGHLRVGELEIDPTSPRGPAARAARGLSPEGVRAAARARRPAHSRLHQGGASSRRLGFRAMGSTRTLDSHACRLRQKLAGRGDRFVVNVCGRWLPARGRAGGRAGGRGMTLLLSLAVSVAAVLVGARAVRGRARERELVARAAHELRGPLTAARLAVHALARARAGADPRATLAGLDSELRRAGRALDDLAPPARAAAPATASRSSTWARWWKTPSPPGGRWPRRTASSCAWRGRSGRSTSTAIAPVSRRRAPTSSPTRWRRPRSRAPEAGSRSAAASHAHGVRVEVRGRRPRPELPR